MFVVLFVVRHCVLSSVSIGAWGARRRLAQRLLLKLNSSPEHLEVDVPQITLAPYNVHSDLQRLILSNTIQSCDAETLHGSFELEKGQCDHADLKELFDELGFGNLRRERWQNLITS